MSTTARLSRLATDVNLPKTQCIPELRFSATLGQEPEVKLALVYLEEAVCDSFVGQGPQPF